MSTPFTGGHEAVVRDIEPHDLAPILHLTGLIPEAPAWSSEEFRSLVTQPADAHAVLIRIAKVAESNHQTLGVVVVQCLRLPGEETQPVECELESILVHPHARRSGIGQRLLLSAVEWCRQQRATVLRLEVRESNRPAISLYEKNGFALAGKRPRYYAHPDEDALLLQLSLLS